MGVSSEKQFGSKETFGFGGLLVCRWLMVVGGGVGSCGFSHVVGCVGAEFIPVVAIVMDEVGDFMEGLILRYDVLERHGVGMGETLVVGGLKFRNPKSHQCCFESEEMNESSVSDSNPDSFVELTGGMASW